MTFLFRDERFRPASISGRIHQSNEQDECYDALPALETVKRAPGVEESENTISPLLETHSS